MPRKVKHTQLTIRGFDANLHAELIKLARSRGISLNKAALLLLRKGAGLAEPSERADVVGDSLDHLIGTWSKREEQAILKAVESFEGIDEALWS